MSSIQFLTNTAPSWATISQRQLTRLKIKARSVNPSGLLGPHEYQLLIAFDGESLQVSEVQPGSHLPKCCVERHINSDGTFCLFWRSTVPIKSQKQAGEWWSDLGRFLAHQEYAVRRRVWPIHAGLSHGDAAFEQVAMEEIAKQKGWVEEIKNGIFRKKGWLGGRLPRFKKVSGGVEPKELVNARTPCPRGCLKLHPPHRRKSCDQSECRPDCGKPHSPILRASCPNRESVERLVLLEHRRRRKEAEFYEQLKNAGVVCCGTMNGCALAG